MITHDGVRVKHWKNAWSVFLWTECDKIDDASDAYQTCNKLSINHSLYTLHISSVYRELVADDMYHTSLLGDIFRLFNGSFITNRWIKISCTRSAIYCAGEQTLREHLKSGNSLDFELTTTLYIHRTNSNRTYRYEK